MQHAGTRVQQYIGDPVPEAPPVPRESVHFLWTENLEGFRFLALRRQGTTGDPSFNACRETCRELVYHCSLLTMDPQHEEAGRVEQA